MSAPVPKRQQSQESESPSPKPKTQEQRDRAEGPGGAPPDAPRKPSASHDATDRPGLLAWDLKKAAEDARASRNRVLGALVILVIAAASALAAGLVVKETVFWAATAPVFGAAAMVLVAYGADRLGVFSQTAELLSGRAAGHDASADSRVSSPDLNQIVAELASVTAWDIYENPPGIYTEMPREQLFATVGALNRSALLGNADDGRRGAIFAAYLHGNDCDQARNLFLQASVCGSTLAAYNFGALQGCSAPPESQREELLAWAYHGSHVAAFMVGTIDAPPDRDVSHEPGQVDALDALRRDIQDPIHSSRLPDTNLVISDGRPVTKRA